MSIRPRKRPHILFLFSDTGGGHRSAAEAIIEALQLEFGDAISTEMVDFFKVYAPEPLKRMPAWYPFMVRLPQAWALSYHLSDGRRRVSFIHETTWPYVRKAATSFAASHNSDMIVSVHPVVNAPAMRALGEGHPPFITVVTDLVTTHAMWYSPRVDLCIVPTEAAFQRGLKYGMTPDQMQVIGLPVANRFCQPPGDPQALRARLGWPQDRPVILLVGGGEGMGPLEQIADAIAEARLPAALIVIAGRNQSLKTRLEKRAWPMPTRIYGFVREMPDFMRAADILVTKAGPGTVSEAFNAGLPLVLYSRLPGQEDGNVTHVVSEGAGIWAPTPEEVVGALRDWLTYPSHRLQAAENSRRAARPDAARQIARTLAARLRVSLQPEKQH
jgi:1,2-diacylglycerol 3-beta-galactosyltransferase